MNSAAVLVRAVGAEDAETSIIARAFLILTAFRDDPVLGVSDLARRTGLPRTTVHRIANQLFDEGALSRVGTKYRVGATMFELGSLHFPQRLREVLQPVLDDLQRITGWDVSLLELVGQDTVVIAASRTRRSRSKIGFLGQRLPAHISAGGQVLLAYDGRPDIRPLLALTTATVVDRRRLRKRLTEVRTHGLAVEHGEAEVGRSGVAVPVLNRHGRVLGSLMLTGPTDGLDADAMTNTASAFGRTLTAAGQQAAVGFFASVRPRA